MGAGMAIVTDFMIGLLAGATIGVIAGFFVAALCEAQRLADKRIEQEQVQRGQPGDER